MLPGFRFLFAAIVLSVSMLIFGLGAAALLRAAHEQFSGLPLMRPPSAQFARQIDSPTPMLTMLRVEPTPSESKPLQQHASVPLPVALPIAEPMDTATAPAIAGPDAAKSAEPDQIATLIAIERKVSEPSRPPEAPVQAAPAPEADPPAIAEDAGKVATLAPAAATATPEPVQAPPPVEALGEPENLAALGEPLTLPEFRPPSPRPKPVVKKRKVHVAEEVEPPPRRRHIRRARPVRRAVAPAPGLFGSPTDP